MGRNPFMPTGPAVGAAYGDRRPRPAELAADLSAWGGASHAVVGGLHMGRSTLLRAAEDELRARLAVDTSADLCVIPVAVPLRAVAGATNEDAVLGFLRSQIRQSFTGPAAVMKNLPAVQAEICARLPGAPAPASLQDVEAAIDRVLDAVQHEVGPTRFALLIKNIDVVAAAPWADALFDHLNALVHDGAMRDFVRLVVTGSERLLAIKQAGSPLLARLTVHDLGPLSEGAARKLIALAPGLAVEVVDEVIALAGGHPFILQFLLHELWEGGIPQASRAALAGAVARFRNTRGVDLDHWWQSIGPHGQAVYGLLRRFADWTPKSEIILLLRGDADEALRRLSFYGLVTHDGSYLRYKVAGRLFSEWCAPRCPAPAHAPDPAPAHAPAPAPVPAPAKGPNRTLGPDQLEPLQGALLNAYDRGTLEQMVFFRMGVQLDQIVGPGGLEHIIFELIKWAQRQGRLEDLILGAGQYNLGNPALRAFIKAYGLAFAAAAPPTPGGGLEVEILRTVKFANVADWRATMLRREYAVCQIDAAGKFGTGTLVGPDLVLTCFHVMDAVTAALRQQVVVRFDHKTDEIGVVVQAGPEYHLAEKWLVVHSPVAELDFVVLRLSEPAGKGEVTGAPGLVRGWVTPRPHPFNEIGEPLLIIQHPKGAPQKIAAGSVRGIQGPPERTVYTTNTLVGSSGAPCFSHGWELVAVHRSGDPVAGNSGIPCSAILAALPAGLL